MNRKILALGADIKNRLLLSKGRLIFFGPDIADLSQVENFELFKQQAAKMFKQAKPNTIACDLHPGYFSTLLAKEFSAQLKTISLEPIQHHHAHIASVVWEHKLAGPVLGVSFDGTGFGSDGNSWGGEFLLVKGSNLKRLAHLKYRKMPGGDKVVAEPWRMALSILGEKALPFLKQVSRQDRQLVDQMLKKNINSPLTSSAGRLFDAAAALLGVCAYASFEAEGPIKLEKICQPNINDSYKFDIFKENDCLVVDTDNLFLGMLDDLTRGQKSQVIATKFHNSMIEIIVKVVRRIARLTGTKQVALSGGVFQNNFLKEKVTKQLTKSDVKVFTNVSTPVNDFNISLGQYYVSSCTGRS
ncbi:hypothetical protein ACFL1I_06270 [Candidatus Omnitrophota bacterium]